MARRCYRCGRPVPVRSGVPTLAGYHFCSWYCREAWAIGQGRRSASPLAKSRRRNFFRDLYLSGKVSREELEAVRDLYVRHGLWADSGGWDFVAAARVIAAQIAAIRGRKAGGVVDPRSVEKARHELEELRAELRAGDFIGALTEIADVAYYAAKAVIAGLWTVRQALKFLDAAIDECRVQGLLLGREDAVAMMKEKYRCRVLWTREGRPKRPTGDALERRALRGLAEKRGIPLSPPPGLERAAEFFRAGWRLHALPDGAAVLVRDGGVVREWEEFPAPADVLAAMGGDIRGDEAREVVKALLRLSRR